MREEVLMAARAMKMTEAGAVTLPAEVRRQLGLKAGSQLTPVVKGRVVVLVPVVDIRELRGSAVGADVSIGIYREGH